MRITPSQKATAASVCLLVAMLATHRSHAHEPDLLSLSLEELMKIEVVTASQYPETPGKSASIISVITARQLQEWGIRRLEDALPLLPGVVKSTTYLGQETFTIRGITPGLFNNKSLLLINGHPSYESLFGSTLSQFIAIQAIERIEVLRSPASVLYGTNAMSGVINIITKQSDTNYTDATIQAGSNHHVYANVTHAHSGLTVSASGQNDNGYNYTGTLDEFGNRVNMDYRDDYTNLFIDAYDTDWRINLAWFQQKKAMYGINPWVWQNGIFEHDGSYLDLNRRFQLHTGEINVWLRYDLSNRDIHAGEFPFPGSTSDCASYNIPVSLCTNANPSSRDAHSTVTNQVERYTLEVNYKNQPQKYIQYVYGANAEIQKSQPLLFNYDTDGAVNPNGAPITDAQETRTVSAYGQVNYHASDAASLVAGIRVENNSDAGSSSIIPRIGITYQVRPDTYLKALYSQAYRTPVFIEKYVYLQNVLFGNENLKREKIQTLELGMDSRLNVANTLQLTLFHVNLDDEILRQPVANSIATEYVNAAGKTMYGLEFEWRSILHNNFEMIFNGSLTQGEDDSLGASDASYIANHSANLILTYHINQQYTAALTNQYVGRIDYLLTDASSGSIDAYDIVCLTFNYEQGQHKLQLSIENLLDEKYSYPEPVRRNIPDVPGGTDRAVYLSYSYRF